MDQQAVKDALDRAIETVANKEFRRLHKNSTPIGTAKKIEYALKELRKLQSGKIPDYTDEWVALLYLTWYQPSQINLVYSVIKKMLSKGVSLDDKLHVVDFGCGARAMQFGVALAVADALEQGKSINTIRFDLIDNSQPMISIGRKVWKQFKRDIRATPSLEPLNQACSAIKSRTFQSTDEIEQRTSHKRCWVSAIHAVYKKKKGKVKRSINSLVNDLNPDVCLTTTNQMGGKGKNLLSAIWTANNDKYRSRVWSNQPPPQFNGKLTHITQWRTKLCEKVLQQFFSDDVVDVNFIRNYLNNPKFPVTWEWRDAAILIHTKRR